MTTRALFGLVFVLVGALGGCTTEVAGTNAIAGRGGTAGAGGQGGAGGSQGNPDAPGIVDAPPAGKDAGVCIPALDKGLGSACGCNDECSSGFCADGVCCNTACNGACVSCNQPSARGECKAVPSGVQDPHAVCAKELPETCGRDGTCNGLGACARYPVGAVCRPAACSGSGLTPASTCDGNGTCLAGAPINCSPSLCVEGACKLNCAGPTDCAPPHTCTQGSCGLRGLGQMCTVGTQCKSGHCVDGVCCDSACTGRCSSCGLPPSLGRCVLVGAGAPDPRAAAGVTDPTRVCLDQGPGSCGTDGRCDGNGGCQRYGDGTQCKDQTCDATTDRWTAASVCMGGSCITPAARACAPNRCGGNRCGSSCNVNIDCAPGHTCLNGSCGKKPQGQLCARDSECASNFCSQGVCCNGRCGGTCQSCNLPGSQGVCLSVPPGGSDPTGTCRADAQSTCGNDGTCDGNGGCRKWRPGTRCADARCSNGVVTAVSTCNGSGTCQTGARTSCPGIMCDPLRPQCLSGCSRDSQCIAPNTCQSGKCGQSDPGGSCEDSADCKQTPSPQFCVSGICCNVSSCSGCRTCATGTCTNVMAGRPPTNSSCAPSATNPVCGNNGTCDGTGKCTVAAAGTACGATCSGDSRVPRTCPGNGGLCAAGTPVSCGTFTCAGGVCLTGPCTGNGDCASGLVCASGACKVPLGGSCSMSNQCVSGSCVSGRCCDCPPVNRCTDAGCNAMGVCNFKPAGAACTDPVCNMAANGTVVNTCDGAGACTTNTATTMCPMASPKCSMGACEALAAPGATCMAGADCASGACLGGRCCTATCAVTDAACAATSCNTSGTCVYPGNATTCGAATCSSDTVASTPVCDGSGSCDDATTVTCGTGLKCGGGVCPTTCSGDGDCLADYTCAAGGVCRKRAGGSCAGNSACASGHCFNNVCCTTGCATTDQGCGVGCNASGACTFLPSGDICAGPTCNGSSLEVSKCDGSGQCQADPPLMCPVSCVAGACL